MPRPPIVHCEEWCRGKSLSTRTGAKFPPATIAGKNAKGIRFEVLVAQQRAAMDLSVFTLDHVLPEPCALSSEIDDANLEVGYDSDFAEKAKEVRTPLTSPSWTFQQTDLNVI